MILRKLNEIERMVQGTGLAERHRDLEIQGVSIDSRTLHPGSLFIPIVREKDGHDYIHEAISRGAAACLWQKEHADPPEAIPVIFVENSFEALHQLAGVYRRQLKVRIVGITGSNGKTTTKDWTASLLDAAYKVQCTEGNRNNHFGVPLTLLNLKEDTEIAVLEMGMSGLGEIDRLSRMGRPEVAIITLNASPTSVQAALACLLELKGYRSKLLVLGDMLDLGEKEVDYHRQIGGLLHPEQVDYVLTLGRLSAEIAKAASKTFLPGRVRAYQNPADLAKDIQLLVEPGDVVFLKGSRGMRMEQLISMVTGG